MPSCWQVISLTVEQEIPHIVHTIHSKLQQIVGKKVKVVFLYSATYTVNHRDQPCFTILEVAVDWQEPMVLQRKLRPSTARIDVQLDPRHAASKHTTALINHTRPSPRKLSPDGAARARKHTSNYSLLLSLSTSEGWKAVANTAYMLIIASPSLWTKQIVPERGMVTVRDRFNFWKISDNILKTVEDSLIVCIKVVMGQMGDIS